MSKATKPILLFSIALTVSCTVRPVNSEAAAPLPGVKSSTAASTPASVTPAPALQQTVVKESAPSPQDNSVEAFFQVGRSNRNSARNLLMQSAIIPSSDKTSKWRSHGPTRLLWHVMDNAGIPMFFGQDTSYIDPSIKETYVIPAPLLPRKDAKVEELEKERITPVASQAPTSPATPNSPNALQKIPESELEGVPLPTLRDEINAPKP
jgi:hypothetical protein